MGNMSTKQKIFLNMITSLIGLCSVGISGYLGETTVSITLIIIFGLIIAAYSYIITKDASEGFKKFELYFDEFLSFITLKQNKIEKVTNIQNDDMGKILSKINDAVDQFQSNLQTDMKVMGEIVLITDKVEQGIFKCRAKSSSRNPMLSTLIVNVNKMLDEIEGMMSDLSGVLTSYSNDDYRSKVNIPEQVKADMRIVLESVNTLGESLSNSAKMNLTNGEHLENSSSTMTQSVTNLANKANQQAASLEETAAAVEEITSITRNNANNAVKMSELGSTVKTEVSNGMNLANETSSSMDQINEQVTAINEAITVIDQIAVQTNILSLNAAVEAATAGEAGKGLAVEAQEVRSLASRSAEAANTIGNLMSELKEKTDEGSSASLKTSQEYESLSTNLDSTFNLIQAVVSSTREQQNTIEKIHDSIINIDNVTQENNSVAQHIKEISQKNLQIATQLVQSTHEIKF